MAACSGNGDKSDYRAFCDSVATLSPGEAYSLCRTRLAADPDADGRLYHAAYYKAIDADSVTDYARLLDSISAAGGKSPNRNYIAAFRSVCSYVNVIPSIELTFFYSGISWRVGRREERPKTAPTRGELKMILARVVTSTSRVRRRMVESA